MNSVLCDGNTGSEETSEPKPVPSLLVGYEQEWLSVSPHALRYWVCPSCACTVQCSAIHLVTLLGFPLLINELEEGFENNN